MLERAAVLGEAVAEAGVQDYDAQGHGAQEHVVSLSRVPAGSAALLPTPTPIPTPVSEFTASVEVLIPSVPPSIPTRYDTQTLQNQTLQNQPLQAQSFQLVDALDAPQSTVSPPFEKLEPSRKKGDSLGKNIGDTKVRFDATHSVEEARSRTKASARMNASIDATGTLAIDPLTVDPLTVDPLTADPLVGLVYLAVKRTVDIVMSATLLILLFPVLIISALLVKLTDGGSAFYPHTRVGAGGAEFTCYKFRSMLVDAEKMKDKLAFFNSHDDHRTFKIPNDPRVTRVGRWMRRTSIDELPQLVNVLKGEMSMVGPRPPIVTEVEQYTWNDMQRLAVKPGLTCIWQVSGRSRLPFPEQLKLDIEYIENRSLSLDLKLIALTIPAILSADGAY